MYIDRMRSWLKALVLLVALAAGCPAVAWAHTGHGHGMRSPAEAVDTPFAVVAIKHATASHLALTPRRLARAFIISIPSPSSGHPVGHAAKGLGGSEADGGGTPQDAVPANEPVEPVDQGTCCCGGIACHAGMAAPGLTVSDPWTLTANVELPPVLALAGAVCGGIERPPRGSIPL